jgi:large subunit ribosomal protein L6
MSRIGKKPVEIPKGVEVKVQGRQLAVKGPKGELGWAHPEKVSVAVEEGRAVVTRSENSKAGKACHGLVRSILQNMVIGVSDGYTRVLEITGVGQGDTIAFSLGYSHPIEFKLPPGIKAESDKKQVVLTLTGIDKQLIGQVAANIKALRPPRPTPTRARASGTGAS